MPINNSDNSGQFLSLFGPDSGLKRQRKLHVELPSVRLRVYNGNKWRLEPVTYREVPQVPVGGEVGEGNHHQFNNVITLSFGPPAPFIQRR
ncbi:hypothetical protein J6590_085071 [Homalodisca vitripennis]|nr:hypothetical protein J6590_085071 [Homalodisca vitripennis]